ncbi:hypothetical protein VB002_01095 [Campylobacter concisus]
MSLAMSGDLEPIKKIAESKNSKFSSFYIKFYILFYVNLANLS